MNITIDGELLILTLLEGNMCSSVAIPTQLGDYLSRLPDIETIAHLELNKTYYELWSKFGWDNELRRREYIQNLGVSYPSYPPHKDYTTPVVEKPNPEKEKKKLREQLRDAFASCEFEEVKRIKTLMEKL